MRVNSQEPMQGAMFVGLVGTVSTQLTWKCHLVPIAIGRRYKIYDQLLFHPASTLFTLYIVCISFTLVFVWCVLLRYFLLCVPFHKTAMTTF